jgi:hypothetical protein
MKYTKINIEFQNHTPEVVKVKLIEASLFLQVMINSTMFKKFVVDGYYTNNKNELNLSNSEIFEFIKKKDWDININFRKNDVSGNRPMTHYNGIINVRDWILNDSKSRVAAVLAHEYLHYLGFMHTPENGSSYGSFSSYVQFDGEKLFRKYENKIPSLQIDKTLVERKRKFPLCWFKKLVWR